MTRSWMRAYPSEVVLYLSNNVFRERKERRVKKGWKRMEQ